MAEPTPQSAARLSEDINDVLGAIRRLIADDEALNSTRDRLRGMGQGAERLIDEDGAEFLARRYGGNAELARNLVQRACPAEAAPEPGTDWPLGKIANAPSAARPKPAEARIHRHLDAESAGDNSAGSDKPRNDLVRALAGLKRPGENASVLPESSITLDTSKRNEPPLRLEPCAELGAEQSEATKSHSPRRVWIRPEPRLSAEPPVAIAAPEADSGPDFAAMVDQDDDFAEAFDWKARMRPDSTEEAVASVAEEATAKQAEPSAHDGHGRVADPGTTGTVRENSGWVTGTVGLAEGGAVAEAANPKPFVREPEATRPADAGSPGEDDGWHTVTGLSPEEEERSISELLREMIQEELHGELGQRFSRNLRAVIRREVAAAIEDQLDRF